MSQRTESRAGGRHRRETVGRHVALPFALAGRRTRHVVMAAAFGAALVTGITGGVAAAAESWQNEPADVAVSAAADLGTDDFGSGDEFAPVDSLGAADAPAPPVGDLSLQAAGLKTRPKPVVVAAQPAVPSAAAAGAAWVNPNPAGRVTSCYGQRWGRLHAGVDIAGPNGSPILAAGAGVVVRAGEAAGYGNAVLIDHGNGYLTHYGHMSAIAVRDGEHVAVGQRIGDEGSTGHSTGPHLHFEVHAGHYKNPVEPTRWLHEHGVALRGC
ncbi:M23 family metallopeptidase [Actinoplanes sp. NPDC049596]|uniref:M23 family metallopeptidase n=1 Tax=unclassified Actinoplanes TaxID=2626549 RepID=UPI003412A72D